MIFFEKHHIISLFVTETPIALAKPPLICRFFLVSAYEIALAIDISG